MKRSSNKRHKYIQVIRLVGFLTIHLQASVIRNGSNVMLFFLIYAKVMREDIIKSGLTFQNPYLTGSFHWRDDKIIPADKRYKVFKCQEI